MTTEELIAEAAGVLKAAGFKPVEYEGIRSQVVTPGFLIEATLEEGVLYITRDRLSSGALSPGGHGNVQRALQVYARHLELAGWYTVVKGQFLLASHG